MNTELHSSTESIGQPGITTYLPSYDGCYVCGQHHPRGLRLRFFTGNEGEVCAWFQPDAAQTGYDNVVHGGVISALLDELSGWTVSFRNDLLSCTAELTVRFVKPVLLGQKYLARARAGTGRGKCWSAEGALYDEQGSIYAKALGKYFLFSPEQTRAMAMKMRYQAGDIPAFQRWLDA
jgi:uncharacterized protein (TIGR00369 family)